MRENTGFRTIDVYHYILQWAIDHEGNTPSQRQIAAGCGCSNSTAHHHTQVLIGRGLLERKDGELCVVRSTFTVAENAWQWEEIERVYPDIMSMTVMPKDHDFELGPSGLNNIGIFLGSAIDEEFVNAHYPDGWKYVASSPLNPSSSISVFQLFDDENRVVGSLRFDKLNYKAKIYFWDR